MLAGELQLHIHTVKCNVQDPLQKVYGYQLKRFIDITSPLKIFLGGAFFASGEIKWLWSLKHPAGEWFEGELPTKNVPFLLWSASENFQIPL